MSDNPRVELFKAYRDTAEKYIYFMLAASGTAIGFAMTQTQNAKLSIAYILLVFALACWSYSFWSGCRRIQEDINLTRQNYELLRIQDGLHPQFPNDPKLVSWIKDNLHKDASKSGEYASLQIKFLFFRALFYVLWDGMEMYLRTFSPAH